ncbi:anti-repressor Ant [Iodobacter phage PhiPLPE]|uniref:Anti-repressor Ant n=1 Tax=Iodobacter phage PhiPLPE TaxID=551895 RepID=B5AX29_9CAUD|nr:anti-repressor [Iodobacter phage PhiPLPE]ACG60332.1 anti-repressor Ant [Iodobacter phage PhiPLPE]
MNLVKLDSVQTMSSREIAEMTGKQHKDVLRDLRKMADDLEIDSAQFCAQFGSYYQDASGKKNAVFNLPKRETLILVSGYSAILRAKIIDRWQELEAQQAPQLPTSYIGALEELLASKKAEAILQEQLALAAPAKEFVDNFVTASTGSMGFREVCKVLNVKESTFRKFLEDQKIIYKLHGGKMPYANHLDAGRFEVKAGVNENGHAYNAYRFTAKGVEWVAGELAKWQLRGGV